MQVFGYDFKFRVSKKSTEKQDIESVNISFAPPRKDDGAIEVQTDGVTAGGVVSSYVNIDGSEANNQDSLVKRYRKMALVAEVDEAISYIVNDAITIGSVLKPVDIVLDGVDLSDGVKKKIREEHDYIMSLLGFSSKGYDIFREFYIDGRILYHQIKDEKGTKLVELRRLDPLHLKKVREVIKKRTESGVEVVSGYREYYIYNNPTQFRYGSTGQAVIIAPEEIINVTSGLMDAEKKLVLSHLHKAIKPLNNLTRLEDATVIYRLARAPERRLFYLDVGNLPKTKAEQYVADMMNKYKTKMVYNAVTGEVDNDHDYMSMLEDFWLPRREGGKGTEISTLQGGTSLGEIDDVIYMQKKLYKSLNVPITRLEPENSISLGRASDITRDELKFSKFIDRMRNRFNGLFLHALRTQLILKKIINENEWSAIYDKIQYDYIQDFYITEEKDAAIMQARFALMGDAEQYIGKYFSEEWARKNVLRQTDDDIEEQDTKIEEERKAKEAAGVADDNTDGGFGGDSQQFGFGNE
ncbi:MAG: hypothetical protein BV459_00340 [Thermoplasmata archaeon M11B2D]|nr:MAG: hypothetical protein BV459_00340 [Thermoplasmata archaeon M11B2D]